MMCHALLILSLLLPFAANAETQVPTLSARIEKMQMKPEDFFHSPRSSLERFFFKAGVFEHWKLYQKNILPDESKFHGYILHSDPYHRGLKRISFLLGSDCSNFVHRTFQILGAHFPYLKTRHWIHLAKAFRSGNPQTYYLKQNTSGAPIDLRACEWQTLLRIFRPVEPGSRLQRGDLVIYPLAEGIFGTKGHMGFVSEVSSQPLILQSAFPDGIISRPLEKQESFVIRYVGRLSNSSPISMKDALEMNYPETEHAFEDACGLSLQD